MIRIFVATATAALVGMGCGPTPAGGNEKKGGGPPPAPVSVASAKRTDVDVTVSAIGWVEPFSTVTIRSQVDGELIGVHFKEGDDVAAGQVLFTIDARPYEAALHLAEANLKRDEALAEDARREAERIADLFSNNQGSPRERDRTRADADAKAAQVRASAAQIEQARLQVERCTIRSPIAGRAGTVLSHRGNIVKQSDTPLVVLNQVTPIYVAFSVAERHVSEIRAASEPMPVEVRAVGGGDQAIAGLLTFINNEVDRSTGMIRLKASFENADRRLWPGEFVDVKVTTRRLSQVVTVPSSAIQAGQDRMFVFVVAEDKTVEARTVVTGLSTEGQTVVTSGLRGDETVVTDGHLRLTAGGSVQIKQDAPAASQPESMPGVATTPKADEPESRADGEAERR